MIYSNLHAQITAQMTESSSPVDAPVALSSLSFKLRSLDLEDKRQVTSSYVCPPNPATSSQKCKSPENPAAGLAKQKQNYEKFSDFPNKRIRNYKNTANHSRIGLYILIHKAEIRRRCSRYSRIQCQSGQALLPSLKLCQKGLVPAAPALRACATSTPLSSARQTFPSG